MARDNVLQGLGTHAAHAVSGALMRGIGLGQKASTIAQSIGQTLREGVQRAVIVARDSLYKAFRAMVSDNEAVGWYWEADLNGDPPPCAACVAMHGTFHEMSEELDSHPNCRCQKRLVYPEDMEEDDTQSGEQWFDEQDTATQKAILGPGLYDLYSNGDITLSDVVAHKYDATYGRSIAVKPLKQLTTV